jgi:hypothetical protein
MRWRAGLLLPVWLWTTSSAVAAPPSFDVDYHVSGEGCLADRDFRREVAARVTEVRPTQSHYAVDIRRVDNAWEGTLTVTDEHGAAHARTLRGASCIEVTHAIAFLTALVLELGRLDDASEAPSSPAPSAPRAAHPPASPPPVSSQNKRAPAKAPAWIPSLGIAASARGGLANALRPAGELFFGIALDRASALAPSFVLAGFFGGNAGDVSAPAGRPGVSLDLWLLGGRASACPLRFRAGPVEARPCAGFELGAVIARAQAVALPRTNGAPWFAGELSASVRVVFSTGLFVEAMSAIVIPAILTDYYIEPASTLYRTPDVTVRLAIAVGLQPWQEKKL